MKLITLIMGLALSQFAFAGVCELSLHSTPYKPSINIRSFVSFQCDSLPSGSTEFATREEATYVYMQMVTSWSKSDWKNTQCQYAASGSKYSCRFESIK